MASHALRTKPVQNALGSPPEVWAGQSTPKEVQSAYDGLKAVAVAAGQRWRKDQVSCLDVLITCSSRDSLTPAKHRQYLTDALKWLQARFQTAKVLTCAFHDDELTPHLQVLVAPIDERGHFAAAKLLGGPAQMRKLQDDFHAQVSQKYNLDRGEVGSKSQHIPMQKLYGFTASNPLPKAKPLPPLPPEPRLIDRLKPGYAGKRAAYDKAVAARQKVASDNTKTRAELEKLAETGRAMHPVVRDRVAAQYRKALAENETAKRRNEFAVQSEHNANKALQEAKTALQAAQSDRAIVETALHEQGELRQLLRVADGVAKKADPRYLARISFELGIELKPGQSVLDQVRRGLGITGQGSTIEALRRLDQAAEVAGAEPVSVAAHRQIDRDRESDYDAPQP